MRKIIFTLLILYFHSYNVKAVTIDLTSAIKIALKNNRELKVASLKLKEAKASVNIARSSFFPSVELSGNYTYIGVIPESEMKMLGYVPMPTLTDPFRHTHTLETVKMKMARENNYSASLSITQPLFMWGRLYNNYKIAKIQYDIEKEKYFKKKLEIIKKTKNAYYSYLIAKENAKLMKETFNQLKENVKSAKINYQNGIITKYDYEGIKIKLDNMEPSVRMSENGVIISKIALKNTLGLDTDKFEVATNFIYHKVNYDMNKVKKIFLNNNSDLKILQLNLKLLDVIKKIDATFNKPSLLTAFNYKYTYIPENDDTFGSSSDPNSWNISLILKIPVSEWFPWSKTFNKVKKDKYSKEEIKLLLKNSKEFLLLKLKQLLLELNTEYSLIESQKINIKNAEETYKFREKEYKSGMIRNTELIEAQVSLTEARKNYLEAVYKYVMAKANLDELLGIDNQNPF